MGTVNLIVNELNEVDGQNWQAYCVAPAQAPTHALINQCTDKCTNYLAFRADYGLTYVQVHFRCLFL